MVFLSQCLKQSKKYVSHQAADSLLFMSPTLLPQQNASAAGVRTTALLKHFGDHPSNLFPSGVHYACGKPISSDEVPGKVCDNVYFHHVPANRSRDIQSFLSRQDMKNLRAVIFDRFFSEEAYSFHFYKHKPGVLRILDMQDMHSLRRNRQTIVENHDKSHGNHPLLNRKTQDSQTFEPTLMPPGFLDKVLRSAPDIQNEGGHTNSHLLREIAAIHRSDLTLVCSPTELELLQDQYSIPKEKLVLAPFFAQEESLFYSDDASSSHSFQHRRDFATLGGFKHAPNIDSVLILKREIWPRIRARLPHAKLHIYGAYPPNYITNLHDKRNGFLMKGYVSCLDEVLGSCRVLLAPLRFGAGIKGKIIDAWTFGCPVSTTLIGSEGMVETKDSLQVTKQGTAHNSWGGLISSDTDDFVKNSILLYSDKKQWQQCRSNARYLLSKLYDRSRNFTIVDDAICHSLQNLKVQRAKDLTSALLWHNTARSTEYFSRWIELKETL